MAEPFNLNKFRKARAKADAKHHAEQNRIVHGLPKAVKKLAEARTEKARAGLEAKKRED